MTTSAVIAEMIADVEEFLDSTDGLDDLLSDLRTLAEGEAPEPDQELLALLAGSTSPATLVALRAASRPTSARTSRRNAIAGLAAATVAGLSITGAAAAANELPAPIQRVVAHFSESYLPFSFPRPAGDPPPAGLASGGDAGVGTSSGADGSTNGGPVHARSVPKNDGGSRVTGSGHAATTTVAPTGGATPAPGASHDGPQNGQDHGQGQDQGHADHADQGGNADNGGDSSQHSPHGHGSGSDTGTGPQTGTGHAYAGQGNAGKGVPPTAAPGHAKKPGGDASGSSGQGKAAQSGSSDRAGGTAQGAADAGGATSHGTGSAQPPDKGSNARPSGE